MTIKNLGRMGAALGLCLTITIVSLGNVFNYDVVTAEAVYQDNNKNASSFIKEINDVFIDIEDTTLLSATELEKIVRVGKISNITCSYNYNGDKDSLYSIININSKNYIKDNKTYSVISEIQDEKVRTYIENTILDIINKAILDKNRKDDVHKLLSLKIVLGDFEDNMQLGEYLEKDNLIIISLNNIKIHTNSVDDLYMSLFNTINHEFNHMFVSPCEDNKNDYKLDTSAVSFLNEAQAESYNYNILTSTYQPVSSNFRFGYGNLEERKYEGKLFLLSFLDNDKPITDYYQALFKGDILKFCNYLNAYNNQEIKDLLSVLWLIDARLERNNYWDRLAKGNYVDKTNDVDKSELLADYTNGVIESYLLKASVTDLINYNINKETLSLDENLILYHFILINILDSASYNSYDFMTCKSTYTFYSQFIKNYQVIENIFFEYLASINGVTYQEIKEYYDSKDKDGWLINIESYAKNGIVSGKDGALIANLVNKFPKIKNIVKSDVFLSNFNYNNLVMVLSKRIQVGTNYRFKVK